MCPLRGNDDPLTGALRLILMGEKAASWACCRMAARECSCSMRTNDVAPDTIPLASTPAELDARGASAAPVLRSCAQPDRRQMFWHYRPPPDCVFARNKS